MKSDVTSIPQKSPSNWKQLELFPLSNKPQKPQIESIPGIPPREEHRYRVKVGNAVLGNFLTIDQALELAKRSTKSLTPNPYPTCQGRDGIPDKNAQYRKLSEVGKFDA